jgi:transitional endoplasmic reticulum ATPase
VTLRPFSDILEDLIMHRFERWIVQRYLANALKDNRFAKAPHADKDIVAWLDRCSRSFALPVFECPRATRRRSTFNDEPKPKDGWKAWRSEVVATARAPAPSPSPFQRRIEWLANACSLTSSESWILGLLARTAYLPSVRDLVAAINDRLSLDFGVSGASELRPFLEVGLERCDLSVGGRLAHLGLIEARDEPRLSGVVREVLSLKRLSVRNVSDLLLGKAAPASLGWHDFAHLGDMRELAARIVGASGGSRGAPGTGANILFYGPPGTGKSEFAKTLGARLGFSVQFAGEASEDNAEPNRRERIAALMIANAIGGVAKKTIIVVDEADDLFAGVDEDDASTRHGSKVFMNRLVERTATPTIWITNDIGLLGPAVVRRMNLVLRFSRPGLAVRKKMVERIAKGARFSLEADGADELARMPASPALLENAIRSTAKINGSANDARNILESGLTAIGVKRLTKAPAPIVFDPKLSSADVDLTKLADQIVRSRSHALSFCLSGPPGSGKSAYARHLAERLDLEVLEKRFSDLSSMYLGESEKAIAAAFEEAADLRAFLILDEADSLLRDRSLARNSWEVTQINEMLTWMERHPHPFACTTNAPDLLDPAMARRILFKVRFQTMTSGQIAVAYCRAFGSDAPASVLKLTTLTPGDFATVVRKAAVLREHGAAVLAKWLEDEALAKPDARRQRIGF